MKVTEMSQIGIIEERSLKSMGITKVAQLANIGTHFDLLVQTLRWTTPAVHKLVNQCSMVTGIKGLSTSNVRALELGAGIEDVHALSQADAQSTVDALSTGRSMLGKLPSVNQVQDWITQAQKL